MKILKAKKPLFFSKSNNSFLAGAEASSGRSRARGWVGPGLGPGPARAGAGVGAGPGPGPGWDRGWARLGRVHRQDISSLLRGS